MVFIFFDQIKEFLFESAKKDKRLDALKKTLKDKNQEKRLRTAFFAINSFFSWSNFELLMSICSGLKFGFIPFFASIV